MQSLHEQAKHIIPGGVNSPVRAFSYVGGTPLVISHGEGAHIVDIEGKRYVDYVGAYGPMIVGHSHPEVCAAVHDAVGKGFHFGTSHTLELALAQRILTHMPYLEQIRLVSSGTEACMSAVRLARAYTGRSKIIKFRGCYHGHSDALLVDAGSGALSGGVPSSPGVLAEQAQYTLVATFNDLASVEALLVAHGHEVAAIIVEPIAGNMGMILPQADFLPGLRHLCDEYGALLLFDEVMTGFRVALGGSYALYPVLPDLVMLGKVIGGGFPVGAFAGRAEILSWLAPVGPVYQAGTLSGSPIALAAGCATMDIIAQPGFYESLAKKSARLTQGMADSAARYGLPFSTMYAGGMFGFAFVEDMQHYTDFSAITRQRFITYFHAMLSSGIHFAPSPYEAAFISMAHSDEDIHLTGVAHAEALKALDY